MMSLEEHNLSFRVVVGLIYFIMPSIYFVGSYCCYRKTAVWF